MQKRKIHIPAILSILICADLVVVGLARFMSYSRGTWYGDFARESFLSFLAYQPDSYVSTHIFNVLATPSVAAAVYFLIRLRNRAYQKASPLSYETHGGRMDFKSPILRLIITAVISLHWVAMEFIKYKTEGFYPFSALESPATNALVLLASAILAFFGMKYLSFEPFFRAETK